MKAKHLDVYEYYRGLIALRRAHPMFRLETAAEVRSALEFLDHPSPEGPATPPGCLGYLLRDVTGRDSWARALVLANPQAKALPFHIPAGDWRLYVNGREARLSPIAPAAGLDEGVATVSPRSVMILGELRAPGK
jgi:pullulanase